MKVFFNLVFFMLAYNELSNRYSRQCRLTCQLCVLSSYLSLSCWCHAGVMIVVWQTPGNTGTRGHLVIVGGDTAWLCLETYRQYKHIWNKQLASPPQLHLTSALYPRNRRVASSPAQAMRFLLFSVWRGSDPPGAQVAHHARQADQWAGTRARSTTRSPHRQIVTSYLKYD